MMSQQLQPSSFCSVGKVLYLNEDLSDLTVIVPTKTSRWKFPAHKLVLQSGSRVLRSKLEAEDVNEIELNDMTPSTTELLLRYLYRGELEVENWHDCIKLLHSAFNLEVEDLVQKCGSFLENVISLSNVCYIYDKAAICSLAVLQDKCLKLILDAGFVVLRSEAFGVLSKDCVMDIIASQDLNIDSELQVFKSLFRWARSECCRSNLPITDSNVQTLVKPFLQHVCIDDMSDADKSALPPSVLSCVKPNNRNRIGFSVLKSLLLHSRRLDLEFDRNCLDMIGDRHSCVRFSVDSPIHWIGVRCTIISFVTNVIPSEFSLTLIKENTPKVKIFSQTFRITSSHSTQINQQMWHEPEILFRQPVWLKPDDVYNLYLQDRDSDSQCPRILLSSNAVRVANGFVNFTFHGEMTWGITSFILI